MPGPRRSTRLQTTKIKDKERDENTEDDTIAKAPPAKRARKKKDGDAKVVRGRKAGKLRMLMEMPMDVLFEIFGKLHPLDLLRLSWTTQDFRRVLMRKSAYSVWIETFNNSEEPLPECPKDLTEPQWAYLLFYPCCHYCGSQNCQNILWYCRVRCCNRCLKTEFVDTSSDIFEPYCTEFEDMFFKVMPHHWIESKEKYVYPIDKAEAFMNHMNSMLQDEQGLWDLFDTHHANMVAMEEHVTECQIWHYVERQKRATELENMRIARRDSIKSRLRESGLDEELTAVLEWDPYDFNDHPLISQPKQLTDRIWNNIKTPLIQFVQEKHAERRKWERFSVILQRSMTVSELYKEWVKSQSPTEPLPSVADVCIMKEFDDIIMDPSGTPDVEGYEAAMAALPHRVEEWTEKVKLDLCRLLPALPQEHPDPDNAWRDPRRLELATTIFRCTSCRALVHCPGVFFHRCMTRKDYSRDLADLLHDCPVDDPCVRFYALHCEPWNHDGNLLSYDEHASELARALVEACGLDPAVTTKEQMDDLSDRFVCLDCPQTSSLRYKVMSWNVAIEHRHGKVYFHHDLRSFRGLRRLSLEDANCAIRAEENEKVIFGSACRMLPDKPGRHPWYWCCRLCGDGSPIRDATRAWLFSHLVDHGVNVDPGITDVEQYLYHDQSSPAYCWPPTVRIKVEHTCLCSFSRCEECSTAYTVGSLP